MTAPVLARGLQDACTNYIFNMSMDGQAKFVASNDTAKRQGQLLRRLAPPVAKVEQQFQTIFVIDQRCFMDEQAGINCVRKNRIHDSMEDHGHGFKVVSESSTQNQHCRCIQPWHRDFLRLTGVIVSGHR